MKDVEYNMWLEPNHATKKRDILITCGINNERLLFQALFQERNYSSIELKLFRKLLIETFAMKIEYKQKYFGVF